MLFVKEVQIKDGYDCIEALVVLPDRIKNIKGLGVQTFYRASIDGVDVFGGFALNNGAIALVNPIGEVIYNRKDEDCVFYNNLHLIHLLKPVNLLTTPGYYLKVVQQDPSIFKIPYHQFVRVYISHL